jgi:hypothetical protein
MLIATTASLQVSPLNLIGPGEVKVDLVDLTQIAGKLIKYFIFL